MEVDSPLKHQQNVALLIFDASPVRASQFLTYRAIGQ